VTQLLFRRGRPDDAALRPLLDRSAAALPTYDFVGATVDAGTSSPYAVHERHLDIGRGAADFDAAVAGLRAWVQHRGVLARVRPEGAPLEVGVTVVVVLPVGPVVLLAPCRIVRVVDEERRAGFAYGSLPGHPETGEEAFLLDHLPDGAVRFTIRVTARAATPALRLVEPLVTVFQRVAIRRYLGAMASHVETTTNR
jgi:uncharacterized protein (UPF0548 family)